MGSSYWRETVLLETTVEDAFKLAQQRVFHSGAYFGSEAGHATIRAAVDAAGADGTHSILDLDGVGVGEPPNTTPEHQLLVALGMVPGEGPSLMAYPVPVTSVLKTCGTHLPTRTQFQAAEDALCAELRRRGSGFYLPLCDDAGNEVEVVFFGWTGD